MDQHERRQDYLDKTLELMKTACKPGEAAPAKTLAAQVAFNLGVSRRTAREYVEICAQQSPFSLSVGQVSRLEAEKLDPEAEAVLCASGRQEDATL